MIPEIDFQDFDVSGKADGEEAAAKRQSIRFDVSSSKLVYLETMEDFQAPEVNEGHRPSIRNKDAYRNGAQMLIGGLGVSCGTDAMIILERLLRGIVETPEDPYFWVKDWLALGYDRCTEVAYENLQTKLLALKFPSNDNPSLFEQFEMPSFGALTNELSRRYYRTT